jgi:hypothetical protein
MRDKSVAWLSIFYSLCLQVKVRKCLDGFRPELLSNPALFENHFPERAVLLFNASSGTYDPLVQVISSESSGNDGHDDIDIARHATQQETWGSLGVRSSVKYLQYL